MINGLIHNKPRMVLLNKVDMADPKATSEWVTYFEAQGIKAIGIDSQTGKGVNGIVTAAQELMREKRNRMIAKGIKPRAIRALILGIPNVGKSTLINRLANKNIAKTGDRPGVTTAQQWVKVGKEFELLDTPGILWPKFDDQNVGYRLALTGAIKDTLLDFQDISLFALRYLSDRYPNRLIERYQLEELPDELDSPDQIISLFDQIGKKRGCLMSGGLVDYDKTAEIILRDIRSEKLGKLSFEQPTDVSE
jgi:ribosome biogenesis GTPase A